ncbi:MAG: hypothetical protein LBT21_01715, partial [Oscillospiraceae bacterium]|nr:hypothetical protein [Oscillospiraceae bacterium]
VYAAAAAELCGTSGTGGAFYAVRSAHVDPAELLAAADALHSTRVVLLGSCAGTAAALTLAARLEQAGMPAAGVFLIASAPAKYKNSPWRFFGDRAINRYLSKLNGQSFKLAKHEIQSFRADTDYFFEWQKQPESPAHTPIYLLTGDADPMLSKMNPRADWERLLGREVCARSVPGGMHYLPHTHAELLARWILDAEC